MRVGQAVRRAGIHDQLGVLDEFARRERTGRDRHDLVVVAVENQRRYVKLLEILGKVRLGKGLDAIERAFVTGLHSLKPEVVNHAL